MPSSTSSSSSASRRRRWRALQLRGGAVALGVALCVLAWRSWAMPNFPRKRLGSRPEQVRRFSDHPDLTGPLFLEGEHRAGGLLILGDSRAQAAIVIEEFEELHGNTALLAGPSGQLVDLFAVTKTMEPGRLLICLSPLSVFAVMHEGMAMTLDKEREPLSRRGFDEGLNEYVLVQRRRLVEPLFPGLWDQGWFGKVHPMGSNGIYRGQLGKGTRKQRLQAMKRLPAELRELRKAGWTIACIRLPIEPKLRAVENGSFQPKAFDQMCHKLKLPYRDYKDFRVITGDGSHVVNGEARRVSQRIARDLVKLLRKR